MLPALCCRAQFSRSWTEGPLTWEDFRITDTEYADTSASSFASFSLIRTNRKVKANGITYKYQDVSAAIDPGQSWVKTGQANEENLKRHQEEFDILQYFATRYREDFLFYKDTKMYRFESNIDNETKHRLSEKAYLEQYHDAIETYRKTGDAILYPVSREPFDIVNHPRQVAEGALEGLLSPVLVFPLGDLGKAFRPAYGISAGFGYREGKTLLSADLTLAKSATTVLGSVTSLANDYYASYLGAFINYGRALLSREKVNFSLCAGAGYSAWKEGTIFSRPTVSGLTLSQGIRIDLRLHRTINHLTQTPQARDTGLMFRLYVNEMYVAPRKIFTPTVNLSVGMNFGFRNLSRN